jgi:putative transposase
MARQLRIEFPGAFYHIVDRGVERRKIFADDSDSKLFLEIIRRLFPRYKVAIHCFCLMPNHYHLLVKTPLGKLQKFMQELKCTYSRSFNRRHHRVGPLFQGRYSAILVEQDMHAIDIVRYIHLNPVKAKMAEKPEDYRWSSAGVYAGKRKPDTYLHTRWVLGLFKGEREGERMEALRRFTMEGIDLAFDPMKYAKGAVIFGAKGFVKRITREKVPRKSDTSVSRLVELRKPPREVLASMRERVAKITADERLGKKLLIYGLRHATAYSLLEVAKLTGARSQWSVAQTVTRLNVARKRDKDLDLMLTRLEATCRGRSEMSNVKP